MFSESVWSVIKQVLISWQVIVITVAIVIYLNIVFYVSRYYRTPRLGSIAKKISLKRKKEPSAPVSQGPETVISGGDSNDELGLAEA